MGQRVERAFGLAEPTRKARPLVLGSLVSKNHSSIVPAVRGGGARRAAHFDDAVRPGQPHIAADAAPQPSAAIDELGLSKREDPRRSNPCSSPAMVRSADGTVVKAEFAKQRWSASILPSAWTSNGRAGVASSSDRIERAVPSTACARRSGARQESPGPPRSRPRATAMTMIAAAAIAPTIIAYPTSS